MFNDICFSDWMWLHVQWNWILTALTYVSRRFKTLQEPYVQQLYEINLDSSWARAQKNRRPPFVGAMTGNATFDSNSSQFDSFAVGNVNCSKFRSMEDGRCEGIKGNPGSVSKSFLAAWHLRCNEVWWSITTLALCEITPLYQSWSIKVSKRYDYFSLKSSRLLETAALCCGQTILSPWMTISH